MKRILLGLSMMAAVTAFADDDEVTESDIQSMRLQLDDAQARQALINQDPKSRAMHQEVSNFAGSEANTDSLYKIAASVLTQIAQEANGDPEKMMQLLQEAQKNPEAFANNLTPEQKAAIRDLAAQIERTRR